MNTSKILYNAITLVFFLFAASCSDCGDETQSGIDVETGMDLTEDTRSQPDEGQGDMGETLNSDTGNTNSDVSFPDFTFDFPNTDTGPEAFFLEAVIPPLGTVEGGTQVIVKGTGFTRDTVVFFGSRQADLLLVDGNLVGLTPAGSAPGPVSVKVLHPTDGTLVLDDGFTYTDALKIDSVSPSKLPTEGGVEVTIRGRGFSDTSRVSFGGKTGLRHSFSSKTLMRVVSPPNTVGFKDLRVSSPIGSAVEFDAVEYFDRLSIDRLEPAAGSIVGGDSVTFHGSGFEAGMDVEFDGIPSPSVAVDPNGNRALVITPPGTIGLADLRIETDSDALLSKNAYYYYQTNALKIAALSPSIGPTDGGIEVGIIGVGLNDSTLEIDIGGQSASILSRSENQAIVNLPPGSAGIVDVEARTSTEISTLNDAFTYVTSLNLDGISPSTGPTTGSTDVTITGSGFTNVERVMFGAFAATFTINSDTEIVAQSPAQNAGIVDLSISRDGLSQTLDDAFTYIGDLMFFGFSPIKGSIAGNTYVELRGRGFTLGADVSFDGTPGVDVQVLDAQTIAVRTPPHPVGAAGISIELDGQSVLSPFDFTYFDPGARFGGAWGDPINGAVNITVYSTDGAPIEDAFVMLSTNASTPYQGRTNLAGLVTLSGPDILGEQTITAAASGFSSTSVQRVDAENITVFLSPPPMQGPPPAGTPPAVFTGQVSGLNKIAEPGPDEFLMAIVQTTQSSPGRENPPPGDANVVTADGQYSLNSRFGDVAVVAVGGLFNNSTQTFKPLNMGIKRFLFATSGVTQTVDLELDIPLNTVLTFKLSHVPNFVGGPVINRVKPYLDLGFEGVFGGMDIAEGTADVIQASRQAPLTGVLADAKYYIAAGSFGLGELPQTNAILRDVVNTSQTINLPGFTGIANLTSPGEDEIIPVNRLFQFDLEQDQSPSFFYVVIQDTMMTPVWNVFLPGNERSFRLPDFPDFSQLPPEMRPVPYPGGLFVVDIIGLKKSFGFNYDNVSYSDVTTADVDSYSFSRRFIQF